MPKQNPTPTKIRRTMNGLGSALLFSQFLACHVFYSAEPDAVDAVPADAKQDAAASFAKA
jgi:hypothetical protein